MPFKSFLNWILLKLAVEYFHIYPTFAQLGTTAILIVVSYLVQRNFTFKKTVVTRLRGRRRRRQLRFTLKLQIKNSTGTGYRLYINIPFMQQHHLLAKA
ncbi:hypothetical protein KRR40_45595 [Niabella defluvii]|nr:hypothetical protein KRR40_45595 [Niabella sp. I65]